MCAVRKAAARLLSPPAFSPPSSAALLRSGRTARGGALGACLPEASHERVHVLRFWVRRRNFCYACRVFDETPTRTAPVWTSMIAGCARRGRYADGMRAFSEMLAECGATPNAFVLAAVVRCCAGIGDVESGKRVHGWMLRNGVHLDVVLCNAVLDMYAKCGQFERARRVFGAMAERDAVSWNIAIGACIQAGNILGSVQLFDESPLRDITSWNTIISGLMRNGHATEALNRLHQMAQSAVVFNHYTYSTAFALAGMLLLPDLGRQLHGRVLTAALESDAFVRSSLMDMYCKCGLLEAAASVFDHWSPLTRDMNFAWSTMVAGYVQNSREEEALELFRRMLREGAVLDRFTLTSVAAACANAGMVEQGRQVHGCVEKLVHKLDAPLASAIVDMYAKCGNLEDARSIFDRACTKNVAVWTSMLCSYASHGQGRMAIELFKRMTAEKMTPNEITLVGVLSACSHVGLVSEGELYFKKMREEYGIVPSIEHYNCIVDLYGRSGLLDNAKNFIEENNINHEAIVWKTLLSACRLHQHSKYAKLASDKLVQLEQCDAGSYVMLSNMYATNNKWRDTFELRVSMEERKVRKQPGRSWIHLKSTVHTFVAGDVSHPQSAEIYAYLEKLVERLKEIGYTSRTDLVVHDVEEEQRETALKFHSEKLAIAFGIISTPSGTPLRIFKNLRVCEDCHEAIKYISQATALAHPALLHFPGAPGNHCPPQWRSRHDYLPSSKAVERWAVDNQVKISDQIVLSMSFPKDQIPASRSSGRARVRHWINFDKVVLDILKAESKSKQFARSPGKTGSHFNTRSDLFQPNEKIDIFVVVDFVTYFAQLHCHGHDENPPWYHGKNA
uniref:DYW domain-containing protein n=1 Tax=Leersia perrieri TaxID=77586 RepID=A0A0D9WX35_9ORYZ